MNKKISDKKYKLKNKMQSKTKDIMKFTFKNTLFSKIFILTNILMIFVVIFLTNIVCKLAKATNNDILNFNETGYLYEDTDYQNERNINVHYTNDKEIIDSYEIVNNNEKNTFNEKAVSTITDTFNSGFVIAFILFFTIYFYGYMVSNSVSEEKTSRVIENLMMSASPKEIVFGKTIAMGLLGIMQMFEMLITFIITTIICLDLDIKNIFANGLNFNFNISNIFDLNFNDNALVVFLEVLLVIVILFAYFIFGYLFYAFICAIAGAGVDRAEDVQMVNGPISILAMIGFYFSVLSSSMPDNKWVPFAKYLPFSSPFSMPVNILNGTTSFFEMIISLIILILCAIWLGFIAIKVYKHVIFNYGKKTSFKDVLKIIFLRK